MKRKPFAFRIDENDYQMLKTKVQRGKTTMTDLIIRAITDKNIVVVDGVYELMGELKALGSFGGGKVVATVNFIPCERQCVSSMKNILEYVLQDIKVCIDREKHDADHPES